MTGGRLSGCGVLVTRAADQSHELVQAIEREGGNALVHPVLAIAPPADPSALDAAAAAVAGYDWVLLTSQNAAEAFLSRLAPGQRPRALACVGGATARACEKQGFGVDLVPGVYNADALLTALVERVGGAVGALRCLMPRAEEGREVLPEGLRALGAQVDVVTAYRTVPATAEKSPLVGLLEKDAIHALTFASPSAVTFFCRLLEGEPLLARALVIPAVCIGEVTATRASSSGFSSVVTAAASRVDDVVEAVIASLRASALSGEGASKLLPQGEIHFPGSIVI